MAANQLLLELGLTFCPKCTADLLVWVSQVEDDSKLGAEALFVFNCANSIGCDWEARATSSVESFITSLVPELKTDPEPVEDCDMANVCRTCGLCITCGECVCPGGPLSLDASADAVPTHKVGTLVEIFADPKTEKVSEGRATLISFVEATSSLELWWVRFKGEPDYIRAILKKELG